VLLDNLSLDLHEHLAVSFRLHQKRILSSLWPSNSFQVAANNSYSSFGSECVIGDDHSGLELDYLVESFNSWVKGGHLPVG